MAALSRAERCWREGGRRSRRKPSTKKASVLKERRVTKAAAAEAEQEQETYEVVLPKPLKVRFCKGNDGCTYIEEVDSSATGPYEEMQRADRVLKVSASFGTGVWDAQKYSMVKYAIKNRSGDVYLQLLRRNGDDSPLKPLDPGDAGFQKERESGDVGNATRQKQYDTYKKQRELNQQRREQFEEAISLYNQDKCQEALQIFNQVITNEPEGMGDKYYNTTEIGKLAQYNSACCHSKMGNIDAGLTALQLALDWGFDDYTKIRNDPSLSTLRNDDRFDHLIAQYDEPVLNENAMRVLRALNPFK